MKTRLIVAVLTACFLLAACNTPIDKAVEWSEDKTDELREELGGD